MSEKPEEEFEDEEPEEAEEAEDLDVDQLMRDFDTRKRRGARAAGEPAWRKLERMREEKRTAGLLSDFDDYDVGDPDDGAPGRARRAGSRRR
jgi:hypothetical protein